MTKPLGFWNCDYSNSLIADIAEHYHELQNMDTADQSWLLARLCNHFWLKWVDGSPSEAALEIKERLGELTPTKLGCLVQAISNKSASKPLGYWNLTCDNRLIRDIHNHFGDWLQNMSDVDQVWLTGVLADYYFDSYENGNVSEAAEEIRDRLHQLDDINCWGLIRALANR